MRVSVRVPGREVSWETPREQFSSEQGWDPSVSFPSWVDARGPVLLGLGAQSAEGTWLFMTVATSGHRLWGKGTA